MVNQVLVDTSVWVSHLRYGNERLKQLLLNERIVCHPFVIAELACGTMKNRGEILSLLQALPCAEVASQDEVLYFIESRYLMGQGLGLADIYLLSSAVLSGIKLWTIDKSLAKAASRLGIAMPGK